MSHLSPVEMQNWLALYAATGLCCAFATVFSIGTMLAQLHQERALSGGASLKGAVLLLPRTWWRWQKLYLLSTPVTLAIVGSFALTLSWN